MNTDLTTLKNDKKKVKEDKIQKWTSAQEELLAEWSEKATCFRWLHSRSEKSYRRKNYSFTIPVIILSTLTGTANFAMDSFVPEENKQLAMACVGGVNIFAGILSTLQNFLRYAELMESHRLCEVQWSKFGRNIAVELALDPIRRKPANDFLKVCRAEYDRLIEQSPPIDDKIIKQFKSNFKNTDIRKPDICNGLDKCKIFKPSEEEKKADVLANAGLKLMERKKIKHWNPVETRTELPKKIDLSFQSKNEDSKDELDGLLNMGKVSSFKNSIDNNKTKKDNPLEIIHEIVKNNNDEEDIEKGISLSNNKSIDTEELTSESEPKPEPEPEPEPEPDKIDSEEEFLIGIKDSKEK
tara:strand:- start:127 stop:1188 length:1062 start_codon:yes stop_codon:yes gene_type:complete